MLPVRRVLNLLPIAVLRDVARTRNLPSDGGVAQVRQRLARSFRGDKAAVLESLSHPALVHLCRRQLMDGGGYLVLPDAARRSAAELRQMLRMILIEKVLPPEFEIEPFSFRGIEDVEEDEGHGHGEDQPSESPSAAATKVQASETALTLFSWGYKGWGSSIPQLLCAFDAVERSRGFEPPVFVDVRARRAVRAKGFRENAFAGLAGEDRYRWLRGLGNLGVLNRDITQCRLVDPKEVDVLLELAIRYARQGRRIIFFCSEESPFEAAVCHRQYLVREHLVSLAAASGFEIVVQEWPGGVPNEEVCAERQVGPAVLKKVRAGGAVPLGPQFPDVALLRIPHGSVVKLIDRQTGDAQLVPVATARFTRGQWELPVFCIPVEPNDRLEDLVRARRALREEWCLEEFRSTRNP